jgi:hypothetical protein
MPQAVGSLGRHIGAGISLEVDAILALLEATWAETVVALKPARVRVMTKARTRLFFMVDLLGVRMCVTKDFSAVAGLR